jgi:hypothetical protein
MRSPSTLASSSATAVPPDVLAPAPDDGFVVSSTLQLARPGAVVAQAISVFPGPALAAPMSVLEYISGLAEARAREIGRIDML